MRMMAKADMQDTPGRLRIRIQQAVNLGAMPGVCTGLRRRNSHAPAKPGAWHSASTSYHAWIFERDAVKMAESQPQAGTSDIPFSSATMPPARSSLSLPLRRFWTALFLAGAVIWSLATVDYRFGQGDDGWQAP